MRVGQTSFSSHFFILFSHGTTPADERFVISNIAAGKSTLFPKIAYFVAIHGAWFQVVSEYINGIPDRPFMLHA